LSATTADGDITATVPRWYPAVRSMPLGGRMHVRIDATGHDERPDVAVSGEIVMTELLKRALTELAKLPEQNQDAIAALILEELEDERRWDESFARSADQLAALAREAREERRRGETQPLDPDEF
jgi:hypothetical protein